jgi:hypothetical protein
MVAELPRAGEGRQARIARSFNFQLKKFQWPSLTSSLFQKLAPVLLQRERSTRTDGDWIKLLNY